MSQSVKRAIKYFFGYTLFAIAISGCGVKSGLPTSDNSYESSAYTIERLKTRSGEGKICKIELYSHKDTAKRYPFTFAIVNGISIKDSVFSVATETKSVDIKIYQVLHTPVSINNLNIAMGDSLVVKAYLKESKWIME